MAEEILNQVLKPAHSDDRGDIYDLVEDAVDHVGLITFKQGVTRGSHYHKVSIQYSYVLEGQIKLVLKDVDGSNPRETVLGPGSLSKIPPNTIHTYTALSDAKMLDITTLRRLTDAEYEDDTVRVAIAA